MFTLPHTQSLIKQVGQQVAAQIYVGYATRVQHVAKSNVNETVKAWAKRTKKSNLAFNELAVQTVWLMTQQIESFTATERLSKKG